MGDQHITFNSSAAIDLRKALATDGQDAEVIAMPDDLSFGPIDPIEWLERAHWLENTLGYDVQDPAGAEGRAWDRFWPKALAVTDRRVVWLSRRSTQEFCGFLEWLRRNGDQPFEIVDLTDVRLGATPSRSRLAPPTGIIGSDEFLNGRLWDLAAPAPAATRADWLALWARLRQENSPLRILTPQGLQSAPLEVFDGQILSLVSPEWKKFAYVVGEFIYASTYESFCDAEVFQTGDMVPIARVAALIASGRIEADGDPSDIHACRVRRPHA